MPRVASAQRTKDPASSDVLYVERPIAPDAIDTMPEATLRAFADHGTIGPPLSLDARDAEDTLSRAEATGIDLAALTAALEREGVRAFCDSYGELLACIEAKLAVGEPARSPVEAAPCVAVAPTSAVTASRRQTSRR